MLRRFELDFPYEQAALNGDAGVATSAEAACMRIVPARELFRPGYRIVHFTGPCRLDPRYEREDGRYREFGPTRKCLCLLSHFGAHIVSRLSAAPDMRATRCRTRSVEVSPPEWPVGSNASGSWKRLAVDYTWHGCGATL